MPSIGFDPCPVYGRATFDKCDTCPSRCRPLPLMKTWENGLRIKPPLSKDSVNRISTTESLDPLQKIWYSRINESWISPSLGLWALDGTAMHAIAEKGAEGLDQSVFVTEKKFETEIIPGYILTGMSDLMERDRGTLWDYKKKTFLGAIELREAEKNKLPWDATDESVQLNIYRIYNFPEAKSLKNYIIVRDWNARIGRETGLEKELIFNAPLASEAEVRLWVKTRFLKIKNMVDTGVVPECTRGDIMKYKEKKIDGVTLPSRCRFYCDASTLCPQFARMKANAGAT